MTNKIILLAAVLAIPGCTTAPQTGDAQSTADRAPADATGLETTYGQSLPPRFAPGAQMPGTGAPAIPDDTAPVAPRAPGSADRPEPTWQAAPQQPGASSAVQIHAPAVDSSAQPIQDGAGAPSDPTGSSGLGTVDSRTGMTAADEALAQSVTTALVNSGLPAGTLSNVDVRTMNGRVILSGQVSSLEEKQQLEAEARNVPGVKTVISQMRIVSANPALPGRREPGVGGLGTSSGSGGSETQTDSAVPEDRR